MPRILLVIGVLAAASLVAYLSNRRRLQHPPLAVAGLGLPPGLVVFTSAECRRCKDVLAAARSIGVPLREVTYELESNLQERVGVTGVPLTLVIDQSGVVVAQWAGRLRMASLRRAVARAGF